MSDKIEMNEQEQVLKGNTLADRLRPQSIHRNSVSKAYSPLDGKEWSDDSKQPSRSSKEREREKEKEEKTDVIQLKEGSKMNLKLTVDGGDQVKEKSVQLLIANMQQLIKSRQPGERKPFHQKMYKTPKETAVALQGAAKNKSEMSIDKTAILSFVSGVFVCFGGGLAINVAYGSPGLEPGIRKLLFGSCFQIALVLIVLFGGELFTGNTMTMTIGLLTKTVNWKQYSRSLIVSFLFNFIGCVFGAAFFNYFSHSFGAEPYLSAVKYIAEYKVNLETEAIFLRAIAANWLVNLAVFMSASAETIEGKIFACYVPIMTFAASSFEHCVANMYFVPLGLMYGADTDFGTFLYKNLILATLGNFIGGAFFMACVIWWVYMRGVLDPNAQINASSNNTPGVSSMNVPLPSKMNP